MTGRPLHVLVIGATIAGVACGSSSQPPSLVATIGSRQITQQQFDLRVASVQAVIGHAGVHGGSPSPGDAMMRQVRETVLRGLLVDAVVADEAAYHHLEATAADVDTEIAADVRAAGGGDALNAQLAAASSSMDQLRDEARARLNEQRLEDYFARTRAEEALHALTGGADFATVAAQYSDDGASRAQGGNAGTLTVDQLRAGDAALATALAGAPLHRVTGPVRDTAGYDLVVVDAQTATTRSFHRILVGAPDPYTIRSRPQWFAASLFAALAQACHDRSVHILIATAGPSPCETGAAATPSASPPAGAAPTGSAPMHP